MPTYEYRCQKGHEFEVFQRMSEPPVEKCIHCGAAAERKLSAGAGILFKGSGFYITENRSDNYKKAAAADQGDGGSPKTTESKTSDTKSTDTKSSSDAKSSTKSSTKSSSKSDSGKSSSGSE
jgi:putative FmdB family regulatory protein